MIAAALVNHDVLISQAGNRAGNTFWASNQVPRNITGAQRQNLDYLLGRSASDELIARVRRDVEMVEGVETLRFCRGHYVGNELHFELIIACRGDITTRESSEIADRVRAAAEAQPEVNMAFVHVDILEGPHHYPELLDVISGAPPRGKER